MDAQFIFCILSSIHSWYSSIHLPTHGRMRDFLHPLTHSPTTPAPTRPSIDPSPHPAAPPSTHLPSPTHLPPSPHPPAPHPSTPSPLPSIHSSSHHSTCVCPSNHPFLYLSTHIEEIYQALYAKHHAGPGSILMNHHGASCLVGEAEKSSDKSWVISSLLRVREG